MIDVRGSRHCLIDIQSPTGFDWRLGANSFLAMARMGVKINHPHAIPTDSFVSYVKVLGRSFPLDRSWTGYLEALGGLTDESSFLLGHEKGWVNVKAFKSSEDAMKRLKRSGYVGVSHAGNSVSLRKMGSSDQRYLVWSSRVAICAEFSIDASPVLLKSGRALADGLVEKFGK